MQVGEGRVKKEVPKESHNTRRKRETFGRGI